MCNLKSEITAQSLANRIDHTASRNTDVMAVAVLPKVKHHLLQVFNFNHARTAEKEGESIFFIFSPFNINDL